MRRRLFLDQRLLEEHLGARLVHLNIVVCLERRRRL
jgi:hypothetical protein